MRGVNRPCCLLTGGGARSQSSLFKIPKEDRNKMTVLLAAGNYFSNALLLKPAPLPLGRSGVPAHHHYPIGNISRERGKI